MPLNIVLHNPEIPHNTGAIGRLCVCLGARLHLVRPLGFALTESKLRRAGMDYWEHLTRVDHVNWDAFLMTESPGRLFFASTKGHRPYWDFSFASGDYLVFGSETSGLPPDFYARYDNSLYTIPMPGAHARSLNLATAVAIVAYEATRQIASPPESQGSVRT